MATATRAIPPRSKRFPKIVLDLFSQLVLLFVPFVCVYVNALVVMIANVAILPGIFTLG